MVVSTVNRMMAQLPIAYSSIQGNCAGFFENENRVLEKPTCDRCGKTFTIWKDVRRHQANCRTVTLVPCDICEKTFSRVDSMRFHMRKKHGIDSPKATARFY